MIELKRILLVEDSAHDIELTLAALAEKHLANEVVVVRDGEEALDYLLRRNRYRLRGGQHPAVVLLDIKLPKLDGLELLRQIRADADIGDIPVVVLTSSNQDPDLKRAYELGASAYVVKPVEFAEFTNVIKEVGLFWAVINYPPPGCAPPTAREAT
ncbi:MAG TPA: response regulator [Phycisphaerae bacterium]|jgi:CheY-like chemotaxis protein